MKRIPFAKRVAALPKDDIEPEMLEVPVRVLLCERCERPASPPWELCLSCLAKPVLR